MIELKGISRIYKQKKGHDVHALNKIDLVLSSKGMVFVLGKSGSGKSTLLNIIGGLDKYDQGDLLIKGKSTKEFKQGDFDSYRNTMIGFIFQEYNVLDEFTVAQNIGLALELQGRKATREAVQEILALVDLDGYAARKPNQLSGGQKQRVAIARALVKNPEIIMADEPTGALDSNTGQQVFETLKKLSETRLVIVVSHDREFAETYGDRIIEFKDGDIISDVTRKPLEDQEVKNLVYTNDQIQVKQGYQLTEEDLLVINKYLQRHQNDAMIEKVFNQAQFDQTDQKSIEIERRQFSLIKSKLPFKSSLKIGASSLKHKTVRLVFSIILAAVSFAMFGLADTMGSYDKYQAAQNSIVDTKINYAALTKHELIDYGDYSNEVGLKLTNEDMMRLDIMFSNLQFKPIFKDDQMQLSFRNHLFDSVPAKDQNYYLTELSGFLELTQQDVQRFNMTLLGASMLPQNETEIMIPSYTYEMFKLFGYVNYSVSPDKVIINQPNDMIGKTLQFGNEVFTISGVVDTKMDLTRFESLKNQTSMNMSNYFLMTEFKTVLDYSQHNMIFAYPGYINNHVVDRGVRNYSNNWQMEISDTTTPTNYYYAEYINKISKVNASSIAYFNQVQSSNLQTNDIILSEGMIYQNYYTEINHAISTATDSYVDSLSNENIYNELIRFDQDISPYQDWNLSEESYYRNTFINMFYHETSMYQIDSPAIKSYEVVRREGLIAFAQDMQPFQLQLTYRNYASDTLKDDTSRVVGIAFTEKNAPNTIYTTNASYESYQFSEPGLYHSALAYLDIEDTNSLNQLLDTHYKETKIMYHMQNEVLTTMGQVNDFIEGGSRIFLYIGIGFAIFSSLMLLNFIATSITYKKQEIGILRAIGARGKDVLGIFFKEAMIIALINFALALGITIFAIITLNAQIRNEYGILITILSFGVRQVILMLLVSVAVAFISSAIPVTRIARKRPIDAIRDR